MSLIPKKEIEERSADLAVSELGADRWERCDTGNLGVQMRDFDLIFPDGHTEPFEVTTSADEAVANAMARMQGNNRIPAAVERVWWASAPYTFTDERGVRAPIDRRRCVETLVPFVERAERDGYERLDTDSFAYRFGHPYQRDALVLFGLGIRSLSSYAPTDANESEPGIELVVGGGGAYGAISVTQAVELAAADLGNQAKLAAGGDATRRHLFVMLTSASETLEYVALLNVLEDRFEEPRLPELPESITTVWASTMNGGIYSSPPDSWKRFGSP